MAIPVILSGGIGSRLWPLSRQDLPKQFLPLVDDTSLFQMATNRAMKADVSSNRLLVVCHEEHQFLVQDQCDNIGDFSLDILLEPCGKNTAAAIGVAACHALSHYGDEPMWIMPADHLLTYDESLQQALQTAESAAKSGNVVCFGIVPTSPATGFGYIKTTKGAKGKAQEIIQFVEKPNLENAKSMLEDGSFLWNSGMFMVKPSVLLSELSEYDSHLHQQIINILPDSPKKDTVIRLPKESYSELKSISIDYAVMEKTKLGKVVECSSPWNDVGSWSSLMAALPGDAAGNVIQGPVVTQDVSDSMIHASKRLVAGLGLKDTVVVETADAVLVADRSKSEEVKDVVANLIKSGQNVATKNLKCNRPWGSYETLILGDRFRVKHIYVNPGASLSLQKHMHRAEHWVIVAGTAQVQRNNEIEVLTENKSIYIPIGSLHRLTNIGKIPLELIEVQTGSYLEEDDIIRFEDSYGREVQKDTS